ncbi:rtxA (fragment) [Vibrio nigripulchritudo MADA3029]|uniref:hypothetical protein n=1 Tax=Vibrio nigripulchritudo TaxID=28173 RepID=UPI0003B22DC3
MGLEQEKVGRTWFGGYLSSHYNIRFTGAGASNELICKGADHDFVNEGLSTA